MIPFLNLLIPGSISSGDDNPTDKYYALFNNSSDAIVVFRITDEGLPGQFTEANDAACTMYQYSREEFLTLSPKDLDSPEGWLEAPRSIQELKKKGQTVFEDQHVRKDGTVFPVKIHATSITFQNQNMCISRVRDLTERRKTEDTIKESEIRYRTLFSEFGAAIMIAGTDGSIQQVNPAACILTGYTEEELCSKKIMDLHLPEDLEMVVQQYQTSLTGKQNNVDTRIRKADGTIIPVEIHTTLIQLKEPVVQGIIQDISDRKKAEEKLKSALHEVTELQELTHSTKNLLQAVLESPESIVIFALDPEYRYLTFNENHRRTMEMIWGVAIEPGMSILDYIADPQDREKAKQNFDRALAGESFTLMEEYGDVVHDRRWYEDKYDPILDEKGTIIGLTVFLTDVTDRRKAEIALAKERDTIDSILDSLPGIFYIFDRVGKLIRWNKNAEIITGYSHEEIVDMTALDFIAEPDRERVSDFLKRTYISRKFGEDESNIVTKDGRVLPFFFSNTIKEIDNEPLFIGMGLDLSERKKIEESLREVNKKLNILSSITRHDIINQITAAEMFVDLMKMEGGIAPDSKLAEDLKMVSDALSTIERQIVFTRDYQDLGVNSPGWQNVGLLVDEQAATLSGELTVHNNVKNLEIYVDPLFEKVIFNLFDNALRHGKTLTTIRFTSEEINGNLKLICMDDGVGVPAEVKEKIFNRQYYQNTGLGLFLSRDILSITGMTISETGVPGEGARFEILVPRRMWRKS